MTKLEKKIAIWKRSLLDLGRRNRMINYRETKRSTLKLFAPSYADLYRQLVLEEKRLTFRHPLDTPSDARVAGAISLMESLHRPLNLMVGDIAVEGGYSESRTTLKNMRAKNKLAHEEQGINILYLSIGFLEWRDNLSKGAWTRSPLVLVPVRLKMENVRSPFTLEKSSDEVVCNPSLIQLFKQNYNLDLPAFVQDDSSVDTYLDAIEQIATPNGWRVIRDASLGLMSFLKINMYRDIVNNTDRILTSGILRAMAGDAPYAPPEAASLESVDLDAIPAAHCFQVVDADSSQQDAIFLSQQGVSFVLQGPPGTGKSQTITNIISQGLAEGKKILFVSEKMAALQVVYRRLQETGLSDFCLPLHSRKADKKDILNEIAETLELNRVSVTEAAMAELTELDKIREELNAYPQHLHEKRQPLECSLYQAFGEIAASSDIPAVAFPVERVQATSLSDLQKDLHVVGRFARSSERFHAETNNPWIGFLGYCASFSARKQLEADLTRAQSALADLNAYLEPMLADRTLNRSSLTWPQATSFYDWCIRARKIRPVPECWTDVCRYPSLRDQAATEQQTQAAYLEKESICAHYLALPDCAFDFEDWLGQYHTLENTLKANMRLPSRWINGIADLTQRWEGLQHDSAALVCYARDASALLGISVESRRELDRSFRILEVLADCAMAPEALLDEQNLAHWKEETRKLRKEADVLAEKAKTFLLDWEPEALSFDCQPMLNRFKTEYTSVLKVFKRQYKEDKRQLRLLAKAGVARLDDAFAMDFLQSLKQYRDDLSAWKQSAQPLAQILGMQELRPEFDWDGLERTMDMLGELHEACETPDALRALRKSSAESSCFVVNAAALFRGAWKEKDAAFCAALKNASIRRFTPKTTLTELAASIDTTVSALRGIWSLLEAVTPLFGPDIAPEQVVETAAAACERRDLLRQIAQRASLCEENFGQRYCGFKSDWNAIRETLEEAHLLATQAAALALPNAFMLDILCSEGGNAAYDALCLQGGTTFRRLSQALDSLDARFDSQHHPADRSMKSMEEWLNGCLAHADLLEPWTEYRDTREELRASVFAHLEEAVTAAGIPNAQWRAVAQKQFYASWIDAVVDSDPLLSQFRAAPHQQRIHRYAELDDEQLHIARARIRAKLIDAIQALNRNILSANDELAILRHEVGKRRAHMPLRKLFAQIPNLLLTLKPCLMMSPLSVSYFLEAQTYDFDMIIFDEASQIMPEDAIGAILRGKQVIIAGDTKQMPPTNFFAMTTSGSDFESDGEESEDENAPDSVVPESILEEAACVLPNCSLLWHYRSRHENLIAFSNQEIYANRLVTFPSSVNRVPDLGVEFIPVENGFYEARQNPQEAKKCVALLEEHILQHPDRSLGIIAFSETQQSLIEDLVWDFRQEHPQYEFFFDETQDEPFFVKNLENVQGDERDAIMFSIGYARRSNGARMNLNFGPLSKAGGERRLNVAITRAKINVKIVASIQPSEIDLTRAKSEGARMLRAYLEFALYGSSSLMHSTKRRSITKADDPFIDHIAGLLTAHGYAIDKGVGYSEYTIDIAVRHPNRPNCYVLGVECDGDDYAQERIARDRDHLRPSVLTGMGWHLYRVWSTEWMKHPQNVESALLEAVEAAIQAPDSEPVKAPAAKKVYVQEVADEPSQAEPLTLTDYVEADVSRTGTRPLRRKSLALQILHVVETEQPLHREELYRRLASAMGFDRVSLTVRSQIEVELHAMENEQLEIKDDFIQFRGFALSSPRKAGNRAIDMISPEELGLVFLLVLRNTIGISRDDLFSESARLLGFERRGPRISRAMETCFQKMEDAGQLRCIEGKVQLTLR